MPWEGRRENYISVCTWGGERERERRERERGREERERERKRERERERERDGVQGGKVFAENLSPALPPSLLSHSMWSLSLSLSLFAGRHQTNTPAPRTNPLSTAPTLPASAIDSHTPIPHYTQSHKRTHSHTLHAHTHTRSIPHYTHREQSSERSRRARGSSALV